MMGSEHHFFAGATAALLQDGVASVGQGSWGADWTVP
jgi:hypothetical protein